MLPALFEHGMGFVQDCCATVRANLDMAMAMLSPYVSLRAQPPDGGYYLFRNYWTGAAKRNWCYICWSRAC